MLFSKPSPLILSTLLIVCACAPSPNQYVVDGPVDAQFQADLRDCETLSQQKKSDERSTRANALIGGILGAFRGDLESVVVGVAAGGLVGAVDDTFALPEQRKAITVQCMRERGHNILG